MSKLKELLDWRVLPRYVRLLTQGRALSSNLIGLGVSLLFFEKRILLVLDLFGSGSVPKLRNLEAANVEQVFTIV